MIWAVSRSVSKAPVVGRSRRRPVPGPVAATSSEEPGRAETRHTEPSTSGYAVPENGLPTFTAVGATASLTHEVTLS